VSNPYAAPKADLGTADDSPPLPRWVRIVRGFAVAGNVFIALPVPVVLYVALTTPVGSPIRMVISLAACAAVVFFSGITITALVSRIAERAVRWTAVLLNGMAIAFLGYAFFFFRAEIAMLVLIPLIANLLVIFELRRARTAE
jgi:hypothetical protein